jgi:antitoxin (DNA-binding transcriptional repressor) of toxin-antitoxin stability system
MALITNTTQTIAEIAPIPKEGKASKLQSLSRAHANRRKHAIAIMATTTAIIQGISHFLSC